MNEIVASERRLSAALDRIDQLLESGPRPAALAEGSDFGPELSAVKAENRRLTAELADLRSNQADGVSAHADPDPSLNSPDMAEQIARLAATNEELIAANRALMDTAGGDAVDEIRDACEAEVEALRAARFAEIANLAEIMAELDRLLGQEKTNTSKPADREKPKSAAAQTSFSGIYGDTPDDGEEEGI